MKIILNISDDIPPEKLGGFINAAGRAARQFHEHPEWSDGALQTFETEMGYLVRTSTRRTKTGYSVKAWPVRSQLGVHLARSQAEGSNAIF